MRVGVFVGEQWPQESRESVNKVHIVNKVTTGIFMNMKPLHCPLSNFAQHVKAEKGKLRLRYNPPPETLPRSYLFTLSPLFLVELAHLFGRKKLTESR